MATSGFEFFGGGFAKGDFETSKTADPEGDSKDIPKIMQQAGYKIATTKSELAGIENSDKCWAYTTYDQSGALSYSIDRPEEDLSLADFTTEGIRLLDNPKGFFMMIEGGKIDWACHANDASSAIQDVLAFDEALSVALAFEKQHPNQTLIVVTGDHECGALSLGYATTKYNTAFEILGHQKLSFQAFNAQVESWKKHNNLTLSKY
jgi:alkaline phosphatase